MDHPELTTDLDRTSNDGWKVILNDNLRMVLKRTKSTPKAEHRRKRKASEQDQSTPASKRIRSDVKGGSSSSRRRTLSSSVIPSSNPWILGLTDRHRFNLENGEWLDDEHIIAAQMLLKRQFPGLDGMQAPFIGLVGGFEAFTKHGVQVLHNGACHWVALSSNGMDAKVFDSLGLGMNACLEEQIKCLCPGVSFVTVVDVRRQRGASDCGLFAIANCLEAALGNNPSLIIFDQRRMRSHLVQCFEEEYLTPFPRLGTRKDKEIGASISCSLQ